MRIRLDAKLLRDIDRDEYLKGRKHSISVNTSFIGNKITIYKLRGKGNNVVDSKLVLKNFGEFLVTFGSFEKIREDEF